MTPKPLSKEIIDPKLLTRAELLDHLRQLRDKGEPWQSVFTVDLRTAVQWIEDLLAAEAYWREAVKNVDPLSEDGFNCNFCEFTNWTHKPDCAWLRAQE